MPISLMCLVKVSYFMNETGDRIFVINSDTINKNKYKLNQLPHKIINCESRILYVGVM